MNRFFALGCALAALVAGSPAAQARWHLASEGGCSFVSGSDSVSGQGSHVGEMDVEMVVYSHDPTSNPVTAAVTCSIEVNGAQQPGASIRAEGTVAVVGAGPISYTSASRDDHVVVCTRVEFLWPHADTWEWCMRPGVGSVDDDVSAVVTLVDDTLYPMCAVLIAAQGEYGSVVVTADGDVYARGRRIKDCVPYDDNPVDHDPRPSAEVVGTIEIEGTRREDPGSGEVYADSVATFGGVLADPRLWTCVAFHAASSGPYESGRFMAVCEPVPGAGLSWECSGAQAVAQSYIDPWTLVGATITPAWGHATTTASCRGAGPTRSAWSGEANEQQPVRFASNAFFVPSVTEVWCVVNGRTPSLGPEGPYRAVCQYP